MVVLMSVSRIYACIVLTMRSIYEFLDSVKVISWRPTEMIQYIQYNYFELLFQMFRNVPNTASTTASFWKSSRLDTSHDARATSVSTGNIIVTVNIVQLKATIHSLPIVAFTEAGNPTAVTTVERSLVCGELCFVTTKHTQARSP